MSIAAVSWQLSRVTPGHKPLMSPATVRVTGLVIASVGAVFLVLNAGAIA
jgi:hypothetical protein